MSVKSSRIVSATIGGVELTVAPDDGELFGGSTWERKEASIDVTIEGKDVQRLYDMLNAPEEDPVWCQQVAALCYAMARAHTGYEAIALQMCAREHWAKSRQMIVYMSMARLMSNSGTLRRR